LNLRNKSIVKFSPAVMAIEESTSTFNDSDPELCSTVLIVISKVLSCKPFSSFVLFYIILILCLVGLIIFSLFVIIWFKLIIFDFFIVN